MPLIGLTGNFGMGKTTVLRLFRKLGAHTFSSDDFVHEILGRPDIIRKIVRILGRHVVVKNSKGTSLNRKHIAEIIFKDRAKRKETEQIIHPEVLKDIRSAVSEIYRKDPAAVIVFEIPLLFEAGFDRYVDCTVTIYCTRRNMAERAAKKGFTPEEAFSRLRAQMPITRKRQLSDFQINNNGDIRDTQKQVERIYKAVTAKNVGHRSSLVGCHSPNDG